MAHTRKVSWECEKEYETLQEALDDEDDFLKDCSPNKYQNFELGENLLTDEAGVPYE